MGMYRHLRQSAVSNTIVNRWLKASGAVLMVLWTTVPLVGAPPVKTTVCAILQKPSTFSGKIVQVEGTMLSDFENFTLTDSDCGSIWVDLPDDQSVRPSPNFKLVRNTHFTDFERLIKAKSAAKVGLIGRLDGVDVVKEQTYVRDRQKHEDGTLSAVVGRSSTGFGHMGQYKARLVLKRVLTVGSLPAPTR
jgi:hypothetical protein